MILSRSVTSSWAALAATGSALLVAGFFALVPPVARNAVAWLGLGVCEIVFLVNFARVPYTWLRRREFSARIPELGLLWAVHLLYTPLAIAGVYYGWVAHLPLRVQVLYQAMLLFALFVMVATAGWASLHAAHVADNERLTAGTLLMMRTALADCDAAFLRSGSRADPEYQEFKRLREDARFLSPCDAPSATSLDVEITEVLSELRFALGAGATGLARGSAVHDKLARCRTLMQLRRQEHYTYQDSGS